jgi:hypothetical protein
MSLLKIENRVHSIRTLFNHSSRIIRELLHGADSTVQHRVNSGNDYETVIFIVSVVVVVAAVVVLVAVVVAVVVVSVVMVVVVVVVVVTVVVVVAVLVYLTLLFQ